MISEAKMVVEVNKQLGGGFEEVLYVSYCVLLFETLTLIPGMSILFYLNRQPDSCRAQV